MIIKIENELLLVGCCPLSSVVSVFLPFLLRCCYHFYSLFLAFFFFFVMIGSTANHVGEGNWMNDMVGYNFFGFSAEKEDEFNKFMKPLSTSIWWTNNIESCRNNLQSTYDSSSRAYGSNATLWTKDSSHRWDADLMAWLLSALSSLSFFSPQVAFAPPFFSPWHFRSLSLTHLCKAAIQTCVGRKGGYVRKSSAGIEAKRSSTSSLSLSKHHRKHAR